MKARITRIKNIEGDTFFRVYKNGSCVKSFYFEGAEAEKEEFYNAMLLAKNIEDGIEEEVIVYETPTQETPNL